MNKSINEINMSVDDSSLIISNVMVDEVINAEDQQIDSLNTTIEQFAQHSLPAKSLIQPIKVNQIEIIIKSKEQAVLVDKESVETLNTHQQKTVSQVSEQQIRVFPNLSLNIRQIIDQMNKNGSNLKKDGSSQQEEVTKVKDNSVTIESEQRSEMKTDENLSLNDSYTAQLNQSKVDMSVDESLILVDIRNIFETSINSGEFTISKPIKKKQVETPKQKVDNKNKRDIDMDVSNSSDDKNDSLNLKEIKIVNNPTDCLDQSPFLKSLPPPKPVFKLSRKRLNCEINSPNKPLLSNNLFKSRFNSNTPLISSTKKWRSATYNPMTSSPKKMDIGSPLKPIDCNLTNNQHILNRIEPTNISDLNIMIQKSDQLPNLIGDYSGEYALPLVAHPRHKDIKTINSQTLANLMDNKFNGSLTSFTIIDARYPYEFIGGHIDGAKNIYLEKEINKYFFGTEKPTLLTDKNIIQEAIYKNFKHSSSNLIQRKHSPINLKNDSSGKRLSVIEEQENNGHNNVVKGQLKVGSPNIDTKTVQSNRHAIIFHCEFSSERGPKMYRHLRKMDRELNENRYPSLYYPEIYLLEGGYKCFFGMFNSHCNPNTYLPMNSQNHKEDLLKFRKRVKLGIVSSNKNSNHSTHFKWPSIRLNIH